jgi:cell division septation protein DedD
MSSEIRPEDIEAAIAAAEQRRRMRLGGAAEPAAAAAATGTGGRRQLIPERVHSAGTAASDMGVREKPRAAPASAQAPDDLDDSWLDQPVRPRPSVSRYADLPEGEVVWEPEPARRGLGLPVVIAAAVLLLFGGALWWIYGSDSGDAGGEVPVIAAAETPIKEKPAEEGGLEVPDQDKLVYGNIAAEGQEGAPKVEQLLPAPEEPVTPPQPQAPAATAQPSPLAPVDDADTDTALAEAAPPAAPAAGATAPPALTATAATPPAVPAPAAAPTPPAASSTQQQAAVPATATPAPAAPAAGAQPAAGGKWKIQLASVKSEQAARQEWGRMQKTHPDMLGDMKLTVQRADLKDKGVFFRIQAGPLPDRTTAEDVCAELKAAKQPCLVVKP